MFQDDDHLLYSLDGDGSADARRAADVGVDSVRVTALWKAIAPGPLLADAPAGFDAANPGGYRPGAWAPYRPARRARARARDQGAVQPDGAGPAVGDGPRRPRAPIRRSLVRPRRASSARSCRRRPALQRALTVPAGAGSPLPRVSDWSIWNEPNQPGWLAPQWETFGGNATMESPALYRAYVDAAFTALQRTGHSPSSDTILVGELAPEGCETGRREPRQNWPPATRFLRALYCVGGDYAAAGRGRRRPRSRARRAAIGGHSWLPTQVCSRRPGSRITRTRSSWRRRRPIAWPTPTSSRCPS